MQEGDVFYVVASLRVRGTGARDTSGTAEAGIDESAGGQKHRSCSAEKSDEAERKGQSSRNAKRKGGREGREGGRGSWV